MPKRAGHLTRWLVSFVLVWPAGTAAQTLKERLSDKASDQQRVDNCHVPPERRGTTPRPDCTPQTRLPSEAADDPPGNPSAK